MALSAFDDKAREPTAAKLAATLGDAHGPWKTLRTLVARELEDAGEAWGFSSAKAGWSLRLKEGDRNILYLTPCRDHFLVSIVLGEKAVKAAHQSDLPAPVLQMIDEAKRYVEGRGIRLAVRQAADVPAVVTLARIKSAN